LYLGNISTQANLGAYQTWANATFGTSTYSNTNVSAYLTSQNITSANIGGSQTYANTQVNAINANLGAYQIYANANAASQAASLNTINANIGGSQTYANVTFSTVANAASQATDITTLYSNAASQSASITTINANVSAANAAIATFQANVGSFYTYANLNYGTSSYANANVAGYLASQNISSANIGGSQTYANTQVNTISANLGAYQTWANANAATQATSIATLQTQVYANANVAAYLTAGTSLIPGVTLAGNVFLGPISGSAGVPGFRRLTATDLPDLGANISNYLPTYTGNISANIVKNGYTWTFGTDGALTLPASSGQIGRSGYTNGIDLYNNNGGTGYVRMNYADQSVIWADSGGAHVQAAGAYTWDFGTDGNLTIPGGINFTGSPGGAITGASLVSAQQFYSSGNVTIDGNVTTQYVKVSSGIITTGASPAPIISGFSSISTTGSGVNEGNITASGNLVASRGAYITGNVIAGNVLTSNYLFANGVNILSTVGAGSYGNTQVAAYIPTDPTVTALQANIGSFYTYANATYTGGGGSTYSNANVVAMLTANNIVAIGNINSYPTQANITQLFVGGNTTITSGAGASPGQTQILNNLYYNGAGVLTTRNTYSGGAGQFYIDGGTFYWSAQSTATANTTAGLGSRMSLSSTLLSTINSVAFTSAGLITASAGLAVNSSTGITTNQATVPVVNATATTINFGGAATTINMGSTTVGGTGSNVFVGNAIGTSNGNLTVRARGTYNTLTLASSQGGYNSPPYSNVALTGGSGTGITASWSSVGGYVNGAITVINPGSGYRNGDTLTLPGGLGSTAILTNYNSGIANGTTIGQADYNFGMDGNLILPGNLTIANVGSIRYANNVNYASTITGTYSNANVVANLANYVSNIVSTANITAAYFIGNVVSSGPTNLVGNVSTGNLTVSGNLISTGYGYFPGEFSESTTLPGVFLGNAGSGVPSPRVAFFNGNTTQNWQIDNYNGAFRWFTPGVTRMTLDGNTNQLAVSGNVSSTNVIASGDATITGNVSASGIGAFYAANRPAFRVVGNGGQITATANATSSNWTVDFNQGSYLNGTNGYFTAPVAGLYQVNLITRTSTNAGGTIIQSVIQHNYNGGNKVAIMIEYGPNTSMDHVGGSSIVKMAVGDTLQFRVLVGTISFDGNDNWSVAYIG
jgi:cytoskeletal protein CcmA (bactofilin family)